MILDNLTGGTMLQESKNQIIEHVAAVTPIVKKLGCVFFRFSEKQMLTEMMYSAIKSLKG